MSSQLSAQAITAQTAITRMAMSWRSHRLVSRGSSSPVKHPAKPWIMLLAPGCIEPETASTVLNQPRDPSSCVNPDSRPLQTAPFEGRLRLSGDAAEDDVAAICDDLPASSRRLN